MTISPITIVHATPDHSSFLAQVILSASRSHLELGPFDIALELPKGEVLGILEWMTLSEFISNCHFSKFLVAELETKPVGALAAFDPGETNLLPLGAALSDAYSGMGYEEADLPSALMRLEAMRGCVPSAEPGTWVVEWVAVEIAHRGQGILTQLLQKILALGTNRSLPRSQISTYLGNQAAINAYQRAGFRIDREYRNANFADLLGSPGMLTMLRDL